MLAGTPAGVPITEVECRALARSRQAERCSRRAVVTLIGDSKNAVISSRPEKQKGKIRPSMSEDLRYSRSLDRHGGIYALDSSLAYFETQWMCLRIPGLARTPGRSSQCGAPSTS